MLEAKNLFLSEKFLTQHEFVAINMSLSRISKQKLHLKTYIQTPIRLTKSETDCLFLVISEILNKFLELVFRYKITF